MSGLPVTTDGRTARLLKVAQALQASQALPAASAKRLVGLAKGVRLYAEAWEPDAALALLTQVDALGREADDDVEDGKVATTADLLARHTNAIRAALA